MLILASSFTRDPKRRSFKLFRSEFAVVCPTCQHPSQFDQFQQHQHQQFHQ